MEFPPEFIGAIIIAVAHLLISFNLKLPDKYQSKFRSYSIVVSLACIIFVGIFSFSSSSLVLSDQGINIYFNGLSALYFGLTMLPGIALVWLFYRWIIHADIQPALLKYIIIIIFFAAMTGLIYLGYYPFIAFFYGFAP